MKQKLELQKLELTWVGKGEEPNLEPRILIENPEYSYGTTNTDNMIIHGDNLLALKSLEQDFAGKVKCIYIDPPYNTGNAFEHYDDGKEHSIWLGLMSDRLKLLRTLLAADGSIWVNLDDNEVHYCKVLMDEIFGRKNFVANVVWQHSVQGKNDAKGLSLNHNYLLAYAKSEQFIRYLLPRTEKHNINYANPDDDPKGLWRSGDVRSPNLRENLKYPVLTPSGNIIAPPENGWRWSEELFKEKIMCGEIIFTNNETKIIRKIYLENQRGRVPETIWFGNEVGTTREANQEIKILFEDDIFATPKPERLIERIIHLATNPGDLVLDSFLGSGTTAAVAHKMGRRYIGIELGDHAYTHCAVRMRKVIDGEQGGISKAVNWQGGGGFKFYELAPPLLQQNKYEQWVINKDYDSKMLAEAMAKHQGFTYKPDLDVYWKQGYSSEQDYIYTTTQFVTGEMIDRLAMELAPHESLRVCAPHFVKGIESNYRNIELRKIPNVLLRDDAFNKSKFNQENYNLNINETINETDLNNHGCDNPDDAIDDSDAVENYGNYENDSNLAKPANIIARNDLFSNNNDDEDNIS